MARLSKCVVLVLGMLWCAALVVSAQQTSTTTETKKFEVISVDGNQLVVKLPEGTRELTVPEGFMFEVDGKQMSVHELKAGMKGTAHITTKTTLTPVTVTEVKNGSVVQVSGSTLIVKTDEGFKMFSPGDVEKRNVKITRDGQPIDFSSLHTGDKLTATIVTAHAPRVVTEKQVQATLAREGAAAPAGAATPAAKGAAGAAPAGTAAPAEKGAAASGTAAAGTSGAPSAAPTKKLPKTASQLPLTGLTALISLTAAVVLTCRRRWQER